MATHPANAVFVSGDGKVSFDENGRKLDSNGNVVWGDRQSLRGANARVRPEIIEAYRKEEEAQRQAAQQPPPVQEYRPPMAMTGTQPQQAPASPWAGVSQWGAPMEQQNWRQYKPPAQAWEPPPSGLTGMGGGQQQNWNQFQPQQPAWQPPPSGLGQIQQRPPQQQQQQNNWNRYQPPRSYNPYMP